MVHIKQYREILVVSYLVQQVSKYWLQKRILFAEERFPVRSSIRYIRSQRYPTFPNKTVAPLIDLLKPDNERVFSGSSLLSCSLFAKLISHWKTRNSNTSV